MSQKSKSALNILRSSAGEKSLLTHHYNKRQPHKKSRNGCSSCKKRRMKCDEAKPVCARCRRNHWECIYAYSSSPPSCANDSQNVVDGCELRVLKSAFIDCTDEDFILIQHYDAVLSLDLLPFPRWRKLHKQILQNANKHTGTLNAILAFSSLHRRQLTTGLTPGEEEVKHSLSAVQSLQGCLQEDWWNSIDSTLTISMFLSALSFADVNTSAATIPLSARSRHRRFEWVGVQMGLRSLLNQLIAKEVHHRNNDSMWLSAFNDVNNMISDIFDDRDGNVDIPRKWTQFLAIGLMSSIETHPYLRIVRRLCHVSRPHPSVKDEDQLGRHLQFVEGITPKFVDRLKDLDPKALVLFAHWLALLCQHDVWWCKPRAMSECWSICSHLENTMPELKPWLEGPAQACGYNFGGLDLLQAGAKY